MHSDRVGHLIPLASYQQCPLPRSAAVVIVGGGVIGASIAYHLAEAGVRNIVLIERNSVGSGSSGKPLGGVRASFSDTGNILLGQRSLEAYEQFDAKFTTNIGLRQVGYLFLCRTEAELSEVEASAERQNRFGGCSRMVSPEEAQRLNPLLATTSLLGASYSPRDGFARPSSVVRAYIQAAQQLGVSVYEETEVLDIDTAENSIKSVVTSRGAVSASTVICAAGAWSGRLGDMAGVSLPVEPVRRQIGITRTTSKPYPQIPFTLDLSSTLYFHNFSDSLLIGISDGDQEPGFCREFSYEWTTAFDRAAAVVAPSLAGAKLAQGWAGLYENTPDRSAVIGRSRTIDGFIYATGFSGHGFLQAPATGELVRDIYLGRDSFIDTDQFSAERFSRNELFQAKELHII